MRTMVCVRTALLRSILPRTGAVLRTLWTNIPQVTYVKSFLINQTVLLLSLIACEHFENEQNLKTDFILVLQGFIWFWKMMVAISSNVCWLKLRRNSCLVPA